MSANSTTQLMRMFEDPVFYEYLIGAIFYIPSFVSQSGLLAQIRVHKLVNDLLANLLINIVCWAVGLFFGLCSGKFFIQGDQSVCSNYLNLNAMFNSILGLYVLFNLESPYKSSKFE